MKETLVSNALQEFYRSRRTETICIAILRRKVKHEVGHLRNILKFKSKQKTVGQIQKERDFKLALSKVFSVQRSNGNQSSMEMDDDDEIEPNLENSLIESDDQTIEEADAQNGMYQMN